MNRKIRETLINIGTGKDYSIKKYANLLLKIICPKQKVLIKFDKKKPNGTLRKVLNVDLAKKYGWKAKTKMKDAIETTYADFLTKNT